MSANPDGVIPNPAKPQSTQLPNQTQAEIQPTPVRDLLFSSPSALSPLPLSSRTTPSAQSLQRPNQNPTTLPANAGEGSAFLRALRLATAIAPSFPLLPRPQIPHQPLKPLFVLVMTLPLPKIRRKIRRPRLFRIHHRIIQLDRKLQRLPSLPLFVITIARFLYSEPRSLGADAAIQSAALFNGFAGERAPRCASR